MVANDAHDWLLRGGLVLSGLALFAILAAHRSELPAGLQLLTQVTAAIFIVSPILQTIGGFDPIPDLLTAPTAGILVPIWAVWTARSVTRGSATAR